VISDEGPSSNRAILAREGRAGWFVIAFILGEFDADEGVIELDMKL
jgi:hypothetical protein